jgi:hypothetical protein
MAGMNMSEYQYITYRPKIGPDPLFIQGQYYKWDAGDLKKGPGDFPSDDVSKGFEGTVQLYQTALSTSSSLSKIADTAFDQVSNMAIPVTDDAQKKAVKVISNGDHDNYITGEDWKNALSTMGLYGPTTSNPASILSKLQDYDLTDILVDQLKYRLGRWLADTLRNIPVVGGNIADRIEDTIIGYSWQETGEKLLSREDLKYPASMAQLAAAGTGGRVSNFTSLVHADTVVKAIRQQIKSPGVRDYNPAAIELLPVADSMRRHHDSTIRILNVATLGREVPLVAVSKVEVENTTDIGNWLVANGVDVVNPGVAAYSWVRDNVLTNDFTSNAIYGTSRTTNDILTILSSWANSSDVACCLLDNLLGVSRFMSSTHLRFLKMLRLGLTFSFNGLCVSTSDLINSLVDLLNIIIEAALGSVVATLERTLDNWTVSATSALRDQVAKMGDTIKRCSPFDELIMYSIKSIDEMIRSLKAYVMDYVNMLKLSHVRTDKYLIMAKNREFCRQMLQLVDLLVKGMETGIMCKDQSNITRIYQAPTPDEVYSFVSNSNYRVDYTANEAIERFGSGPSSGGIISNIGESEDLDDIDDLQLIQRCRDVLSDSELELLANAVRGAVE